MSDPTKLKDDLEGHNVSDVGVYGVLPTIAGVLIGLGLIVFMFALADGFA